MIQDHESNLVSALQSVVSFCSQHCFTLTYTHNNTHTQTQAIKKGELLDQNIEVKNYCSLNKSLEVIWNPHV